MNYKNYIKEVSDFPKKGINFLDITSLFLNSDVFISLIDDFADLILKQNLEFDAIVGPESRSFFFLSVLSYKLNKPFIPIRKKDKLPRETNSLSYDLEYGSDVIAVHTNDLKQFKNVILIDDILATGGTIAACEKLINQDNVNVVSSNFLIEITALDARTKINNVNSLIKY